MAGGRRHVLSRKMPRSFGHGLAAGEEVLEGRGVDAFGVRAALRLLELLRVAEEDDALRGLGHGEDVGEGGLAGLVHEEDVDGAGVLLARPEPGRAGADLRGAVVERGEDVGVVGDFVDAGDGRVGLLGAGLDLLDAGDGDLHLAGGFEDGVEEVADDLVADGGDADLEARVDAGDDHPRAGVRLPRSGRALDGEERAVEGEDGALREVDRVFALRGANAPFFRRGGLPRRRSRAADFGVKPFFAMSAARRMREATISFGRDVRVRRMPTKGARRPSFCVFLMSTMRAARSMASMVPEGSFVAGLQRVVFAGLEVLRRERVAVDGALGFVPSRRLFSEFQSRDRPRARRGGRLRR